MRAGKHGAVLSSKPAPGSVRGRYGAAPAPPPEPSTTPDAPVLSVAASNLATWSTWTQPANGGLPIIEYELEVLDSDVIAVTSSPTAKADNASSLNVNGTSTGTNRAILVSISYRHASVLRSVSGVTFNGDAFVRVAQAVRTPQFMVAEQWLLLNPDATTTNVIISLSGAADIVATAVFLTGIAQTDAVADQDAAQSNGADPELLLTSSTGQRVIDCFAGVTNGAVTAGAGQTDVGNDASATSGQIVRHGCSTEPGANSVNMGWVRAADHYALCATALRPADDGGETNIYTGTERQFIHSPLTNGQTYQYRVRAVNANGPGDWSTTVAAVPQSPVETPAAPVLQVSAGNGQVSGSWNEPNNGGAAITGWKVYRDGVQIGGTLPVAPRTFLHTGLTNGQAYTFRVRGVNSAGDGALSAPVSATPQAGTPGAPNLPAPVVVGQAAHKQVMWASFWVAYQGRPQLTPWTGRGLRGAKHHADHMEGFGGAPWRPFQVTDASNAAQYQLQPGNGTNSGTTGGHNNLADYLAEGWEFYIGLYLRHGSHISGNFPPFANAATSGSGWSNDSTWAQVATSLGQVAAFLAWAEAQAGIDGVTGVTFDGEGPSWHPTTYGGNTRTESQNRVLAEARGYQVGAALWQNHPNLVVNWYHFYPSGSWSNIVQVQNGLSYPTTGLQVGLDHDFFAGLARAAAQYAGPQAALCLAMAQWYRRAGTNYGNNNVNEDAAYRVDSQGTRDRLSDLVTDQSAWNWLMRYGHFFNQPMTWRGTDTTTFYTGNQPSNADWAAQALNARKYGEGHRRWEYTLQQPGPAGPFWGNVPHYAQQGQIDAMIAAASTAPKAGRIAPTFQAIDADQAGATATVYGTVHHRPGGDGGGGIYSVEVYRGAGFNPVNPEPSYLGAARFGWNPGVTLITDGIFNGIPADTVSFTFSTPASNGPWFAVKCTSIDGDVSWASTIID